MTDYLFIFIPLAWIGMPLLGMGLWIEDGYVLIGFIVAFSPMIIVFRLIWKYRKIIFD